MGWLPTWSTVEQEQTPPDRLDRKRCWDSRDTYFACLDKAGVTQPGQEGEVCSKQLDAYEKNCVKSWIKYFNERRVLAERQKGMLATADAQVRDARINKR